MHNGALVQTDLAGRRGPQRAGDGYRTAYATDRPADQSWELHPHGLRIVPRIHSASGAEHRILGFPQSESRVPENEAPGATRGPWRHEAQRPPWRKVPPAQSTFCQFTPAGEASPVEPPRAQNSRRHAKRPQAGLVLNLGACGGARYAGPRLSRCPRTARLTAVGFSSSRKWPPDSVTIGSQGVRWPGESISAGGM